MTERVFYGARIIRRAREINGDVQIDTNRGLSLALDVYGDAFRAAMTLQEVTANLSAESLADPDIRNELERRRRAIEAEHALWLRFAVAEYVRRYWEYMDVMVQRAWRPASPVDLV